ncbi:MAG: hypothetical protein A2Z25_17965 [Planctomycetes bacterium RBG_16_55_9]|nr:MAG: hypothetical protein A2Z25_17965 [Planctomycetes bacterium RBG_16_55_9]
MALNIELYHKLYLIRRSEEKIIEDYGQDEMKTPMHMSMGAEAIAVGVCHALRPQDQVFGTYRSHAIYLAKTQDTDAFFAEMYGKATSPLGGKGGSMHLCAPEYGFLGTSAIVGSSIPLAVGAAFANKRQENNKVVAVFFGDGAIDEGTFWESLNVACLMKLPILFVCEDNGLAVHTPASARHGYDEITDVVSRFSCDVFKEETTDVRLIYRLVTEAVKAIRENKAPAFMHLKYYRYLEHVGVNKDFDAGYRRESEFEEWYRLDPVKLQRQRLASVGCTQVEVENLETEIDHRIDQSIHKAKNAPFAHNDELYRGLFA